MTAACGRKTVKSYSPPIVSCLFIKFWAWITCFQWIKLWALLIVSKWKFYPTSCEMNGRVSQIFARWWTSCAMLITSANIKTCCVGFVWEPSELTAPSIQRQELIFWPWSKRDPSWINFPSRVYVCMWLLCCRGRPWYAVTEWEKLFAITVHFLRAKHSCGSYYDRMQIIK